MAGDAREEERRQFRRFDRLASGEIAVDGRQLDCQVLDVSLGGARVRPVGNIGTAERMDFGVASLGPIRSEVRWRSGDSVGLRFLDAPSTVLNILQAYLPSEYRAALA